jgi:hypothetical protein
MTRAIEIGAPLLATLSPDKKGKIPMDLLQLDAFLLVLCLAGDTHIDSYLVDLSAVVFSKFNEVKDLLMGKVDCVKSYTARKYEEVCFASLHEPLGVFRERFQC